MIILSCTKKCKKYYKQKCVSIYVYKYICIQFFKAKLYKY